MLLQASDTPFDLDAYFARIEYSGPTTPTVETLEQLHLAHATHIPFENLDILLGRPIRLDLASLQAKLVDARRGGYCFEQNTLFGTVLERLGFAVTPLAGRVRFRTHHRIDWAQPEGGAPSQTRKSAGGESILPRTHMILLVEIAGRRFAADVGFGREGLLLPVPLEAGAVSSQFVWAFRVITEGAAWVLQSNMHGQWNDLYVFSLEPQYMVDYEMANYYVSTHPESRFTQTLTVQRPTPEARYLVRNLEFVAERPTGDEQRLLADEDELLSVLGETFGLQFAPGTRFRGMSAHVNR